MTAIIVPTAKELLKAFIRYTACASDLNPDQVIKAFNQPRPTGSYGAVSIISDEIIPLTPLKRNDYTVFLKKMILDVRFFGEEYLDSGIKFQSFYTTSLNNFQNLPFVIKQMSDLSLLNTQIGNEFEQSTQFTVTIEYELEYQYVTDNITSTSIQFYEAIMNKRFSTTTT